MIKGKDLQIGDTYWLMIDNKPVEAEVCTYTVTQSLTRVRIEGNRCYETTTLKKATFGKNPAFYEVLHDDHLYFTSKKELLDSL